MSFFLQDDLLASLLEPGSTYFNEISSPPVPTTFASSRPHVSHDTFFSHDAFMSADENGTNTPQSYSSGSPVDILENSPGSTSPGDVMMMSSNVRPNDELGVLLGSITSLTGPGGSSADVRINVGECLVMREVGTLFLCLPQTWD